jgi:hypothetical protein
MENKWQREIVEIDEKLDFKQHVDTTIKKIARKVMKVGLVGRIQQKLTKMAKITIYNSIISPHLFLANEEYLNRMQIIQNRDVSGKLTYKRC